MADEGQPAPDFTAPDQDGNPVTLSKLRAKPVVLYFYPRDNTPGCTTEACSFRDARDAFAEAGVMVLGVSPDTIGSHRKFAEKFQLSFPLLADPERRICELYGVWKEKSMYGKKSMGVERTTFLIDAGGTIRRVFRKVKVNGHSDEVLAVLRSLGATAGS